MLAALNGLAGLHIMDGKPGDAVRCYRDALQLGACNRPLIRTDPLQRLHTLHNLALLVGPGAPPVPGIGRAS